MAQPFGFMSGSSAQGAQGGDPNNVQWGRQSWDEFAKAVSMPRGINPYPQGQQANNYLSNTFGSPSYLAGVDWRSPQQADAAQKFSAAAVPAQQMYQNAYQYGMDFNEAQRRFNLQQGWTMAGDQFNMALSQRQQQAAEWQAHEAARQWAQQMQYQQQRDQVEQQLALQQVWGRTQAPNVRWMRNW